MRRKPLVVVGVSTAMLVGGVVLATTAGAQESPAVPGMPGFSVPDFFLPYFGGDDRDRDPRSDARPQADPAQQDDDRANRGDDAQQDAPQRPAAQVAPQRQVRQQAVQQNVQQDAAGQQAAVPQAGQQVAGQNAQRDRARDDGARQTVAQQNGVAPQSDAQQRLVDASRATVSAADVSESPASPVQQRVLFLVNQNRRRSGCADLSLDRRLIDAANEHAADMARHDYFAHESRNGDGAGDRVERAGYDWRRYGENIARGQQSAWQVVNGWMHSPEHRENILDCRLHQMGVGLAIAGDDTPYWVQDFATPMG